MEKIVIREWFERTTYNQTQKILEITEKTYHLQPHVTLIRSTIKKIY